MYIGIDFDGTCVTHEFPLMGSSIGAETVLKELVQHGHKLILFTMRSDVLEKNMTIPPGKYLTEAVDWFKRRAIPLFGVQTNPNQSDWTYSPKAYAHLYIDDAALGCPLVCKGANRPYVDWREVRRILGTMGVLPEMYI